MTPKLTKLLAALGLVGVFVLSGDSKVVAATATANLTVNVTVASNCTITSSAVVFPNYDPIVAHASTPDDSNAGSVTITCTKGTAATIGLGLGQNASGKQRRMRDTGTNYLNYELYQNEARTVVWGNASGSWFIPPVAPDKSPRTFAVHGRIPAAQDVPAGNYSDIVVATVNF